MTWDQIVTYRRKLGDKMARLRIEKGFTGRDISKAFSILEEGGKSKGTISRIENGEQVISTDVLKIYSELLGVPIAELVNIDDDLDVVLTGTLDKMDAEYREMAVSVMNTIWERYCIQHEEPKRGKTDRFVLIDMENGTDLREEEKREIAAFIAYYRVLQKRGRKE